MSAGDRMAADADARVQALDPGRSFIVQAPAGSGKTELLIQRFLRLLSCVDEPEEVRAITFTRKAAGEMRTRVIHSLQQAESGAPPREPHLRESYELACAVLGDPGRRHWQLHRHPARLAIGTIDAVNAWLAGRAPLTAGHTALHQVTDHPQRLYREAARATLELLGDESSSAERIASLLAHLDNDAGRFERLLALMLPRRDQWLRHVPPDVARTRSWLEAPLQELCGRVLCRLRDLLPPEAVAELPPLLAGAAAELALTRPDSALCAWSGSRDLPATTVAELPRWRSLASLLLTRNGGWRKDATAADGFPPQSAAKARLRAVQTRCRAVPGLLEALRDTQMLPEGEYSEAQWGVLRALLEVLPLAVAQLRLTFADHGQTDFPEVAADALGALGAGGEPSELGLVLDYRIRHILVDEFQDTAAAQFDLLEQLVAGWEPGDGRSLFLVGDPMQSIYRFREAEVRLFMKVRDHGLGTVRPVFLQLQANFRSDPQLVSWCNATFGAIFPRGDDATTGAVGFAASRAALAGDPDVRVERHWLASPDPAEEARRVAALVAECRRSWPAESVAVLVRSRLHAAAIIAALRAQHVGFFAPELETLERSSVAQDLLALTRALLHPADRLAWLSVMRAPWCGLPLADLAALAGADHERPLWELMNDPARCARLSPDGWRRLERLRGAMGQASGLRGRRSLRDLVEGTWLALGGPGTLADQAGLQAADAFLAQLQEMDAGGDCADLEALADELGTRHATLAGGNSAVQIMTMHKAKGLQFDTVILPGLDKTLRQEDRPVLLWHDVPLPGPDPSVVLAPMARHGGDEEPLYRFLWRLEQQKELCEQDRLLYVACTRARRRLHLFAAIRAGAGIAGRVQVGHPRSGSLLARLWPALADEAQEAAQAAGFFPAAAGTRDPDPRWIQPKIRRIPADWQPPLPPAACFLPREPRESATEEEPLVYEWANPWARYAGSVAHRWLRVIAEEGCEQFDAARVDHLQGVFRRMLAQLGTDAGALDEATARVVRTLKAAISDPRGRWILSGAHASAASELSLTVCDGKEFRRLVLDRTFVAADGHQWLIDYKTSAHEGGDVEGFLRTEAERHREQLRRYRDALLMTGAGPIRTALYFPLLGVFHELNVDAPVDGGAEVS